MITADIRSDENKLHSMTGVGWVLLGALGFSAKAIFIKLAYVYSVDPITLLTLRMGISLPVFLAIAVWATYQDRGTSLRSKDWWVLIALGSVGYYLASLFDFLGLQYVSAGLERLILFIYPTIVVLLSAFFLKHPIRLRELLAIVFSYVGIAFAVFHDISFNQTNVMLGTVLIFISAFSYAIYLIGSGGMIKRLGTTKFTAYAMIISCGAVILQFTTTHDLSYLRLPLKIYELATAMALFSTVLPAFLISEGIRRIGASRTSIIGSIGPVVTIVLARIFLNEAISFLQIAGTALVLTGTLLVSGISLETLQTKAAHLKRRVVRGIKNGTL